MAQSKPLIAIVGRPNVGKSRFFNRLTRSQKAIVEDMPGVTRDRHYGEGDWFGRAFAVVDTGGFDPESDDILLKQMRDQARLAIEEADIIFLMMDGREGVTTVDHEITRQLREGARKPVFAVVNKIDGRRHEILATEFYELGFERIYPISAEHGYMVDELMDDVAPLLPEVEEERKEGGPLKVAVVGRPNVGKSTLINRLLGEERLLTSDVPGTTRDSIDTYLKRGDREYLFIDTAGIRRKRSISMQVEKFSVVQSFRAIDRADVVLFMIEAIEGLADQDMRLINMTQEKGRAHILIINKWDAIEKDSKTADVWIKRLKDQLDYADYAPNLFISAKTGQRVHKIFELIDHVQDQWTRRLPTSKLNKWVADLTRRYSLPVYKRRQVKLYYMTQVSIRPPTFMVSSNHPDSVAPSYKRFLINRLREDFEFDATPLRIIFRQHGARGSATATPEDELEADELLLDAAAVPAAKALKPLRAVAPEELDEDELDDELEGEEDELDSDDDSSDDESSDDESSDDESYDEEDEGDEEDEDDEEDEGEDEDEGDDEDEDDEDPPAVPRGGAAKHPTKK